MKNPFHKRPWLLVVVAFLILIGCWTAFITVAVKNQPAKVPLVSDTVPAVEEP